MTSSPSAWACAAVISATAVLVHEGSLLTIEDSFRPESRDLAGLAEVQQIIDERWVDEPKQDQLLNGALKGMVATLDRFSDFISAEELQAFEESTTGKFGGLGIYIAVEGGLVVVIAPIEDTPAWRAGMLPGDRILRIDGVPCEFTNDQEAVRALKGEAGTSVTLDVLHDGDDRPVAITIERAVIQIRSVKGTRLLDAQRKIGYLRITTFSSGTVDEFEDAIEQLRAQGMRGLILDLRNNPGGFLKAATNIADAFLDEGLLIVQTRGRGKDLEFKQTKSDDPPSVVVPTAVLIDRGSASASEILAGALADHDRATLVGRRSFGKGSVQSIIEVLGGDAELKLTTQHYFTPSGRRIHRGEKPKEDLSWGLIPAIDVPIDGDLRYELTSWESETNMARLKALANKEQPPATAERLHRDDPQVRAAYRNLLEKLGDPFEEAAGQDVAAVDSADPTPPAAPEEPKEDE